MRVNNKKIVDLINKLRVDRDNKTILRSLIEEVSNMVYNYPKIIFYASEDDCSDFYLYFIERLPKFILKYNEKKSSFPTWFIIVLKSYYLNFKKKQKKEKLENSISLDYSYSESSDIDMMNLISYKKWIKKGYDELSNKVLEFIHSLTLEEQVIIKLLYFNLDIELLKNLSRLTGMSPEKCFKNYTDILNSDIKRFEMVYKLKKDIERLRERILEKGGDKELEKRLSRFKKKYYNNLETITGKNIAILLNRPLNEIYYKINKIKRKIKNKFEYIIKEGNENGT